MLDKPKPPSIWRELPAWFLPGMICEIMRDDGTMARVPDLIRFCKQHGLKMLTVAELIRYRMQHERYVHRVGEALINTHTASFG